MKSSFGSRVHACLFLVLLLLIGGEEARAGALHLLVESAGECSGVPALRAQLPAMPALLPGSPGEPHAPDGSDDGSHCSGHCHCGCHAGGVGLLAASDPGQLRSLIRELSASIILGADLPRPSLLRYLLPDAQAPPAAL